MQLRSPSPEATRVAGRLLGESIGPDGAVIALVGALGAGKTVLAKGLAEGLGIEPGALASPTFTLVHEYPCNRCPVFHFDFYRLDSADEVLALDFDGYLEGRGIIVVEWASKFPELFPAGTRWFRFEIGEGDERRIVEVES